MTIGGHIRYICSNGMNEVRIKEGIRYVTRNGVFTEPLVPFFNNKFQAFIQEPGKSVLTLCSWNYFGRYINNFQDHELDLVREYSMLDYMYKSRGGHYTHALEVSSIYELHESLETLVSEFSKDFSLEAIVEFFSTISIYSLSDVKIEEELIYELNIVERVKEIYHEII